jgi:hypothetical protein
VSRVIKAVSIGDRVPDDFRAAVHSVFHTAANFVVVGMDSLLTLTASDSVDHPQGIRLPAGETEAIQRLQPGQVILCQEGLIRSAGYPYEINLRWAQKYDGNITCHATSGQVVTASYQAAWDLLVRWQAEKQADLRIMDLTHMLREGIVTEKEKQAIIKPLADLIYAAQRLEFDPAAAALRLLMGLGGGLTPTGDDVLVGFLAGLRASTGAETARIDWLGRLGKELRVASSGTNDISRTFLVLASDGQFSSSLKNLAIAVCAGEPADKVRKAAEIAFQVGHTSGMDAATGLLAGLAAWQADLIPNSSVTGR